MVLGAGGGQVSGWLDFNLCLATLANPTLVQNRIFRFLLFPPDPDFKKNFGFLSDPGVPGVRSMGPDT